MQIRSPAFPPGGEIPRRHTCEGADTSPPLEWSGLPPGTVTLTLVVDDPDAPSPPWTHWVVHDLPASADGLEEDADPLPAGALQAMNSWNERRWNGPCPPAGRHRYVFRLHAVDRKIGPLDPPVRQRLEEALRGHVLATAELVGTYQRRSR